MRKRDAQGMFEFGIGILNSFSLFWKFCMETIKQLFLGLIHMGHFDTQYSGKKIKKNIAKMLKRHLFFKIL